MNIDEILNMIDDMLEEAWSLPFSGGRCVVDAQKVKECVEDIRLNLPGEIKQAKMIVADRNDIINSLLENKLPLPIRLFSLFPKIQRDNANGFLHSTIPGSHLPKPNRILRHGEFLFHYTPLFLISHFFPAGYHRIISGRRS